MSIEQGLPIQKLAIFICGIIVLLTGLAVGLYVHFYQVVVNEAFIERSAAYATAFAHATDAWLEAGDEGRAKTAARFLLLGSALYVRVTAGPTVLIDERVQEAVALDLSPPSAPLAGRMVKHDRLDDGSPFLDVIIPTVSSTDAAGGLEEGYVRIGVDAATIGLRIRSMAMITSGTGLAFDAVVIGLFLWLLRRARKRRGTELAIQRTRNGAVAGPPLVTLGDLRIDETTKRVFLGEAEVPLTPKQYSLLCLLASDPGRVFSDKEIVTALWSMSSYANSKDVKQQVYLLRRRLTSVCSDAATVIVNIPGFGYKLVPPVVDDEDLTE